MLRRLTAPDVPFRPAALPFFYGWVILPVAILGVLMSVPGQTMGVGPFNDRLIAASGLSRWDLSLCYGVGTGLAGFLLPGGGRLLDRHGARVLVVLSCLGLAGALVFMAHCDRIGGWLGELSGLPDLAMATSLVLGFTWLRFTGQGMLTMVSRNLIGKWFDRLRGTMSGVAGLFIAFGFSIAPQLLMLGIHGIGWRETWLLLAVVIGLGMSGIGWLLFRDHPEECGLRMDGPHSHAARGSQARVERSLDRGEAVRTRAFWAVAMALCSQGLVVTGLTFHIVDLGERAGLGPLDSVAFFVPMSITSTATGFLVGLACDRWPLKWLVAGMALFQAIGFIAMPCYGTPWGLFLTLLGLGCSGGFFGPLSTVAMPRLFGRVHLGAISGVLMSALVIASAIGPVVLAATERWLDSYAIGLWACVGLPLLVVVLASGMRDPQAAA